jgi:hypothetical protein
MGALNAVFGNVLCYVPKTVLALVASCRRWYTVWYLHNKHYAVFVYGVGRPIFCTLDGTPVAPSLAALHAVRHKIRAKALAQGRPSPFRHLQIADLI